MKTRRKGRTEIKFDSLEFSCHMIRERRINNGCGVGHPKEVDGG